MAIIDEIERFEAGANRIRAGAAGLSERQDPVLRPAPRPQVAARPAPSAGTRLGNAVRGAGAAAGGLARGYVASQAASAGAGLSAATALPRAAGGFVRDAGRAVAGMAPSPSAGQPLGLPRLPTLTRRPAPATAAAAAAAAGMPANWSPGPRTRPRPAAAAAVAPAAGAPVDAAASTAFNLQPGDVNTFTGADGVTKPVPGLLNAQPAAGAAAAQQIAARPVALPQARGRQGAIIANPGDSTVDKLIRNVGSYSFKGSPSARNAIAQAILGEAAAARDERATALAAGDRADIAAVEGAARIADNNADRDLAAQQTNAEMVERRADRGARLEEQRLARRPEVTVASDGTMGVVSNDGRFSPVTDQGGRPVRAPQAPRQTGVATQGELLKSYTDRVNAITADVQLDAAGKQAAIAALDSDPLYAGLRGGGAANSTPPPEAIAQLRANPAVREQFDEVFGAGAAAAYLD